MKPSSPSPIGNHLKIPPFSSTLWGHDDFKENQRSSKPADIGRKPEIWVLFYPPPSEAKHTALIL
jgi:hypothetical protein